MRKALAILTLVAVMFGSACSAKDNFDTKRGRGDAGVSHVDDSRKEVIQMPDRFSNVAHACDGHGHRIFVTTKSDNSRFMAVIADDSCGGSTTTTSLGR